MQILRSVDSRFQPEAEIVKEKQIKNIWVNLRRSLICNSHLRHKVLALSRMNEIK